jgi:transcriptional regulator with XRE-family HTH domain
MTQRDLAAALMRRLGRSADEENGQSYVSKLEASCFAALDRFAAIAAALQLPPSGLVVAADVALALRAQTGRFPEGVETVLRHQLYARFDEVIAGGGAVPSEFRPAVSAWADADSKAHTRFADAVGKSLRLHRRERHKTLAEVAGALQRLGGATSESVVSQYETGQTGLSWDRIVAVSGFLEVNLDQVFSLAELLAVEDARPPKDQLAELLEKVTLLTAQVKTLAEGPKTARTRRLLEEVEHDLRVLAVQFGIPPDPQPVPRSPVSSQRKAGSHEI